MDLGLTVAAVALKVQVVLFFFWQPLPLNGQVQELGFDRNMFDYSRSGVKPTDVPQDMGFAGMRVNFHTDWPSDMASFEGASYFRAIDGPRSSR